MSAAPPCKGRLALLAVGLAPLLTRSAWAHSGRPPTPHDLWSVWSPEPEALLAIGLLAVLYARGTGRLWRRAGIGRGLPRWRFYCFAAGIAALFLALISPLDAMGSALFSAHMVQHEVLMLVAAPLLILGTPLIPFLWALPLEWRRSLGRWSKGRLMQRSVRVLTHPVSAWLLYAAALWIWHAPPLYEATLAGEWAHIAQHASFLGSALLFWWVLLHPTHFRRRAYGAAVLYVFTTAVHGSLLGALLTFAREPWYPSYAPSTAAWGLTPLDDQQLGGLVMWIPPGFLYLCIALTALGLWLRAIDARKPGSTVRLNTMDEKADVVPFPV